MTLNRPMVVKIKISNPRTSYAVDCWRVILPDVSGNP
jgi:hypothetical protein